MLDHVEGWVVALWYVLPSFCQVVPFVAGCISISIQPSKGADHCWKASNQVHSPGDTQCILPKQQMHGSAVRPPHTTACLNLEFIQKCFC